MTSQPYRDLPLWQQSLELAELIYRWTATCPDIARRGLTGPLRQTVLALLDHVSTTSWESAHPCLQDLARVRNAVRCLEIRLLLVDRLHRGTETERITIAQRVAELNRLLNALFHSVK